jgi:tetratricopeptide (TPR) repeat protein
MKALRIVVPLLVAVCLALPAAAQNNRGNTRISGKVLDEGGQPVPDVAVRVQIAGAMDQWNAKTDKKGEWRIIGLPPEGRFKAEFTKDGLEPAEHIFEVRDERAAPISVKMTKSAPKVDPSAAINAELQRAVSLAQAGKFAEARKICEDTVAANPIVTQCHGFIARMFLAENQPAKGIEQAKLAIEKDPASVDNKLLLADLMESSGDKAGAKKVLDEIDLSQVKDTAPFVNAAINMINDGKGAEAVDWLGKLIAKFPAQNELYYYRGRAYIAASKIDEAKADLEKFLSLAPTAKEAAEAKKILDQIKK